MFDLVGSARRVDALVAAALPGVTVFWTAAVVPESPPDEYVIVEPLYVNPRQSWNRTTHANHVVQIRACARTVGRALDLAAAAAGALPPDEFAAPQMGPLLRVGRSYDMLITARTHPVT